MILHAVSTAAFFVDTVQQTPVLLNCTQAAPQPEWKWWAGALASWVGPLLSGVVSIYVAWRVFHWQGEKEHSAWIRDQKKAEWSGLLRSTAEIQRILRVVNTPNKERIERIVEKLKPAVHELSVASTGCVFLQDFFADPKKRAKFYSFIKNADYTSELVFGLRAVHRYPDIAPTPQESGDLVMRILNETGRITQEYLEFNEWLRREAADDLGITRPKSR
jgi:hypothetical protein